MRQEKIKIKTESASLFNIGVLPAIWGVYIAQGVLGGLTFAGLPTLLRSQHVSLERIGLLSLVMLIWAIKFLWAQPVERLRISITGRRRSRKIILLGEFATAGFLCVIGFLPPYLFTALLMLLLCAAVFATIVDIACDALLIEQIPENQRQKGNMAQVGGAYIGLVLGGSIFTNLYNVIGWKADCFVMALIVMDLSIPMIFYKSENRKVFQRNAQDLRPGLLNAFRRKEIWYGIVLTVTYEMSGRLAQGLTGPFLIDQGVSLNAVGIFNGIGGVVSGLCGASVGSFLTRRMGAKKAIYVISICHAVLFSLLFLSIEFRFLHLSVLFALFVIEAALMAATFVVSYSRLMSLTAVHQPGIDFTIFQSAGAIAAALLGAIGAFIAGKTGYGDVFLCSLVLSLVCVFIIKFSKM